MKLQKPKRLLAVLLSVLVVVELVVSVIIGTVATTGSPTKTVTKQLIDFSNSTVGTVSDANWPKGISPLIADDFTYPEFALNYNSDFTTSIDQDTDNNKFLKFNFDKRNIPNTSSDVIKGRNSKDIFVKVAIPAKYINYLTKIKLDYIYNYTASSTTQNRYQAYYIFGLLGNSNNPDGSVITSFGKQGNKVDKISPTATSGTKTVTASVEKVVTNLSLAKVAVKDGAITDSSNLNSVNTFTGDTAGFAALPKWDIASLMGQETLDVILLISAPEIPTTSVSRGYFFGIKDITIQLEGPEAEIDILDNPELKDYSVLDFDEGEDLDQVKDATGFEATPNFSLVTDVDGETPVAHTAPNALLFKRGEDSTDPDYTSMATIRLQNFLISSKGISFMARNLTGAKKNIRIWIAPGNAVDSGENEYQSKGKYQFVYELPANMPRYTRIRIFWNDVGLVNFSGNNEWTGTSTSGSTISGEEIRSGLTLRIVCPDLKYTDEGILLDSFELMDPEFESDRRLTFADFRNSEIGTDEIPSNIKIGGNYKGTSEIVETADGTKALRLNYDAPAADPTGSTALKNLHHVRYRPYVQYSIPVPKGSMKSLRSITVEMYNDRPDLGVADKDNSIFTDALYLIAVSAGSKYGKSSEVNPKVDFLGAKTATLNLTDLLVCTSSNVTTYVNKADVARWTDEDVKNIDTIHFYITAPSSENGFPGEGFMIKSINMVFDDKPYYNTEENLLVFDNKKPDPTASSTIKASAVSVSNTDANYPEFDTAIEVEVTDPANTDRVILRNNLIEYSRNLKPYLDTAILHMFTYIEKDTYFDVSLIDKNAAEMTKEILVKAHKSKLYTENQFSIKDLYDEFVAANPTVNFDLTDIRKIAILPKVTEATTFKIAKVSILTKEFVSSAEDPDKLRKVNLVNFDNCPVGSSELPSNVSVSGYGGSKEIVQLPDGSKALQVNIDQIVSTKATTDLHQLYQRVHVAFTVKVPKGSLKNLSKVTYRVVNNSVPYGDTILTNIYYVMSLSGGGFNAKHGQSSTALTAELGEMAQPTFEPRNGLGTTSKVLYWINPSKAAAITDEHMANFDTICFYVGVPECNGLERTYGWNIQIGSIDLEFTEPPSFAFEIQPDKDGNLPDSRMIFNGPRCDSKSTSTLNITTEELNSNDINYRKSKIVYKLKATTNNNDYAVFPNALSTFMRNASDFVETAKFRVFTYATEKTKLKANLVNINGEKLPFEIDVEKNDDPSYNECIVSLKDIYNDFKDKYPDEKFSLRNITEVEIAPASTTEVTVAGASLWTHEPGTGGVPGNFYYQTLDDSARIEGYFNAIPDDFTAEIEIKNAAAALAAAGTKLPAGVRPVAYAKFTLRNAEGDITDPRSAFWISIKVPEGVNLSDIGIYRMYFDGSLVKERHSIEPNRFISVNTFFNMAEFVVLAGVKSTAVNKPDDSDETDFEDDESEYDYEYEYVEGDDDGSEEAVDTPSQVVRQKKVIRKKSAETENYTWLWIVIAVISVVVLAAVGLVIMLLIRKKRRKENQTV